VVQKLGGVQSLARNLAFGAQEMVAQGVGFHSVLVKTPTQIAQTPDGLITIVPTVITMTVPGGRLKKKSYLIGISPDDGRTWTFVDGANLTADTVVKLLPGFPANWELPRKEKPVFVKGDEPPAAPDDAAAR
jgi:hypothetical protein